MSDFIKTLPERDQLSHHLVTAQKSLSEARKLARRNGRDASTFLPIIRELCGAAKALEGIGIDGVRGNQRILGGENHG